MASKQSYKLANRWSKRVLTGTLLMPRGGEGDTTVCDKKRLDCASLSYPIPPLPPLLPAAYYYHRGPGGSPILCYAVAPLAGDGAPCRPLRGAFGVGEHPSALLTACVVQPAAHLRRCRRGWRRRGLYFSMQHWCVQLAPLYARSPVTNSTLISTRKVYPRPPTRLRLQPRPPPPLT